MTPWVMRLIIANVIMFALTLASHQLLVAFTFIPVLVLVRPWTLITYMFLHDTQNFLHILFNMLGLFFFGPRLELTIGGRRFLWLYFLSGLSGVVFSFFFEPNSPIIGASAAVFGVFVSYAYFWPRDLVWIYGIIPVQARWLVVGMTVLSLWGGFGGVQVGIAHFAHLGGFAGGYVCIRWFDRHTRAAKFKSQFDPPPITPSDMARWSGIDRGRLHEVNREEYDRIMAKLRAGGAGSLTAEERLFLDRFSSV